MNLIVKDKAPLRRLVLRYISPEWEDFLSNFSVTNPKKFTYKGDFCCKDREIIRNFQIFSLLFFFCAFWVSKGGVNQVALAG
jgi:hypothetical protein